ncbi:agamous-like MADS-box protein AGL80 [Lotus japonicus]|uniref:agamous-like MADS-box protein AGL80 n=1 Tax=Lotus japonicus TaxID=34305 RepID=UPI00258BC246|nr:agamous-like MADS-box protein AGL80 [Lotus japonicus]
MRGKVKLEYIADETSRRATYLRRKKGLLKNLEELTILAGGIDACALIYSTEFHAQPKEWPSPSELQRIITKFRSYPELERGKKMMNQESLLNELILKAKENSAKMQRKNKEIKMSLRLFEVIGNKNITGTMNNDELNQMEWEIDEKLKRVDQRLIELNNNASTSQSQAQVADSTLVANGATIQAEAHVNHSQSDEMYKKATRDFTSFLKYINGGDDDISD